MAQLFSRLRCQCFRGLNKGGAQLHDIGRRGVAVLLVYSTVAAAMPAGAGIVVRGGIASTRTLRQNLAIGFRHSSDTHLAANATPLGTDAKPRVSLSISAGLQRKKEPPLIATVASRAVIPGVPSGLHNILPRIYADTVGSGTLSSVQSNFNGTAIGGGSYIWFNSVLKPSGLGSSTAKILVRSASVQFAANGVSYNLPVPDATITFSPSATSATAGFDTTTNQWLTTVPANLSGNTFLTGLAFPVPSAGLPGGINPVTWRGQFYTDTSGVTLQWQWAAAVYTSFSSTYGGLGVKPVDSGFASQYQNSDHAGTPELYTSHVTGGARGGGGSNYTGSYSGTAAVSPVLGTPNLPPTANAGPNQTVFVDTTVQLDGTGSTDADGDLLTYQWSLTSVPSGSTATLSSPTSPQPSFVVDKPGSYTAQLVVNDGFVNSTPSTVIISTKNSPPVANAGANQTATVTSTVQLDGSGSTDVDGDSLTYKWSFVSIPTGSTTTLSNPGIVHPTFVVDKKGTYTIQLIVNDGQVESAPADVTITTLNSPPVANAGPNQKINVGQTVQLDGSGSTDVDGDTLTYAWSMLSTPGGSTATISNPTSVKPTFYADLIGTYIFQLVVNDGTVNSAAVTVTISTSDVPPVANPGPAQSVDVGSVVNLDGSASTDSDNQPLTYHWTITIVPANSTAVLSAPTSAKPYFTADMPGNYVVQLIVNDGILSSPPATVTISTINTVPVANPGSPQVVPIGTIVQLSGEASSDADHDPLSYRWAILTQPTGGTAVLANPNTVNPTFVANASGYYVVQLIVNDGSMDSPPATVTITGNAPPVVNAGPNQTIVLPTATVTLNGSATDDGFPNNTLTFSWTGPAGVVFSNPSSAGSNATFSAAGTYVLQLTASDSQLSGSADVMITVNPILGGGSTGSIALTPPSASPVLVGTAQQFQAAVHDRTGAPIIGATVTFTVAGVNAKTAAATTDANGSATFSYTGNVQGLDEVTATEGSGSSLLVSNSSPVSWVLSAPQVSASAIIGNFFTSDGSGGFDTPFGAPPVFSQIFAAIDFNPPAGTVPGAPSSIDVTTRPFTNVTTDANGNYTGGVVAQGNNYQAGLSTLSTFQADFTGTLTVAAAGNVTFNFFNADGFVFGVGGSASRVSGTFVNPPLSGVTVFHGYPVMGSFNTTTAPVANTITVHFPGAGSYPFEIEYGASNQNALIAPGSLWKYSLLNPTGFEQPSVDDSSFVEGFAPFTNAVGAQSPGVGCPLIGATYFPVFGTVDLRKTIYLPSGASNVTAYVAIDNDFTLWINGTLITNQTSDYCAYEWNRTVPIPDSVWLPGENLVAFQARDRGGATGFETQLIQGSTTSGQSQTKPLTLSMTIEKNNGQRAIALMPTGAYPNLGLVALVGALTDSNGQVIEPIAIGTPSKTLIVPPGATQLQLGIDDDKFSENTGSGFLVTVNGVSFTVPPTAMPWRWVSGGLNTSYQFGVGDGGSPIIAASGLTQGQAVTIAYQSGTVSAGPASPLVNADGDTAAITAGNKGSTGTYFPTAYMTALTHGIGESASFTAVVTDVSGALVPNQLVTFNVAGANLQQSQALTDNTGTAHFTYHGLSAGTDVVQAQAVIAGGAVISTQTTVIWNQVTNQPPAANAGPNQTINRPSDTAVLTGTASDDGLPKGTLTATWTQVSGVPRQNSVPAGSQPLAQFPQSQDLL